MSWSHRLLVLWMTAAAVHLPMPVGDGDDLKSGEAVTASAPQTVCWDIDFILLGCDPPDDCDDGPVDDDPENGSGSPLGSYLVHIQSKAPDVSNTASAAPLELGAPGREFCDDGGRRRPQHPRRRPLRNSSFGKACQSGLAVMRC